MAGLSLLALTGCASAKTGPELLASDPDLATLVDSVIGVDIHTHAGGAVGRAAPTINLADQMRRGRMGALCLAHSADVPVTQRTPDDHIITVRDPRPGELWQFSQKRLAWFDGLVKNQGIRRMLKPGDLQAAHRDHAPAIVQTIEGCQFIEGKVERIETVFKRGVRHLQLVHFLRSDLGDNQTESPTQGGLTPLGREVIAECNRLGIVVDVAHGTMTLVEGAAKASKTPLVLSHTAVAMRELNPFTRLISGDHGRLVASTGGVVGIWASPGAFKTLGQYIDGVARAVDAIGVDHVAFGTDNSGFGATPAIWTDYSDFPVIVSLLRRKGFNAGEIGKLVGGNYVRVFDRSTHAV
jgi:membrane dipeptidase